MSGYISLKPERGWFEPLRTKAFGSIADAFSTIGTPISNPTRVFIIWNYTNKDVIVSIDGTEDYFPVATGGQQVIDDSTNGMSLPKGTQFYVKRYTPGDAPTSGSVHISIDYKVT